MTGLSKLWLSRFSIDILENICIAHFMIYQYKMSRFINQEYVSSWTS